MLGERSGEASTEPSPWSKFEPLDLESSRQLESGLPPELWKIVQSAAADFPPQCFLEVSRNLLENPNLTASHLARAELSYQSFTDASFNPEAEHPHDLAKIIKHMKFDHQPILIEEGFPGYKLDWTVVRKLIPRNPKLDKPLMQTCHLFTSTDDLIIRGGDGNEKRCNAERYLVVYLPHVSAPDEIPFYHPKIRALAVLYTFVTDPIPGTTPGTLSLYYNLFPEKPVDNRLTRTALKMLQIIHKHSYGRLTGYQKRVHHDLVITQKRFQDTYASLKGKYASSLIQGWVEQTLAEKHVFEDLGIAAFLIELWTDMYGGDDSTRTPTLPATVEPDTGEVNTTNGGEDHRRVTAQQHFPGFVDIGCGNGLLVWILHQEGWNGWGFDARARKTWETFEADVRGKLQDMLLIPEVLSPAPDEEEKEGPESPDMPKAHGGVFPEGTFIIANHADELTVWTPCLAFLSKSPFIAIPCCSHNFGGTRFRAPHHYSSSQPQDMNSPPKKSSSLPSTYASFCSYTAHLALTLGYTPEKEYLRIPSTRNAAILGRKIDSNVDEVDRIAVVRTLVEKEMGQSIDQVRDEWLGRGNALMKPSKGGGH
ncbi:hypothetical protein BCR34DRAFT_563938 [Clohesyomyces aquaticus]|uniref:tRNA (uracil-O(2)-)-methyltransferase n=1 Tax=Clohesyomyces aquaticus TaxID=1231657 RepID=A0A1Y1ZQ59_9PLEO|nr:hypothetical protein BCR34DRAFT_563938 [Clohesyomyces aquaticus]